MYKKDLALNDLQWSIYHKTKPNQTKLNNFLNIMLIFFFSKDTIDLLYLVKHYFIETDIIRYYL